jgi:hypothetical protein
MMVITGTTNTGVRYTSSGTSGAAYGVQTVDFGAPAHNIWMTGAHRSGNASPLPNGYLFGWGTSLASPFAAGAVGLMYHAASDELLSEYADNPRGLALHIKKVLNASVDRNPNLVNYTITGGRLNVYRAVQNVRYQTEIISADRTMTINGPITKRYLVTTGATLTILNSIITPSSPATDNCQYLGFIANGGDVQVIDSSLNMGRHRIEVSGMGSFIADNTSITMTDGYLMLSQNGLFQLNNGSSLTTHGATRIEGNSSRYLLWYDVNTDRIEYLDGDKIVTDASVINLSTGTSVYSGSGNRWEGIFIQNSTQPSFLRGNIENIDYIRIRSGNVQVVDADIHNINHFRVSDSSTVNMENVQYRNNMNAIRLDNSFGNFQNVDIYENLFGGLSIHNWPFSTIVISDSHIHSNGSNSYAIGIEARNSFIRIDNSIIEVVR